MCIVNDGYVVLDEMNNGGQYSQKLEVDRMLTISTAHIKESTAAVIDELNSIISYNKSHYGWFIYLNQMDADEDTMDIPEDLNDVIQYAKVKGFTILCLDRDGEDVDGLPIYEW